MGLKEKIKEVVQNIAHEVNALKGDETKDKSFSSSREFENEISATQEFELAKQRLFDVNHWSDIKGPQTATFELHSNQGVPYESPKPAIDDYIMIDLPGPFPMFWVKVVDMKEAEDFAEFIVRPSEHPDEKGSPEVKHFFSSEATSTFRVEKNGNRISAFEIGRDETANTKQPEAGDNATVNSMVAGGGWAGFQKLQWESLTDYLVGK